MGQNSTSRRIAALAAALDDLRANRFARAAERCAGALSRDPEDTEALLLAGLAAGMLGDADNAAASLRHAAQRWGGLAAMLRRVGRPGLVEPVFRAALRHAPDDAKLRCAFADWLHETGQSEAALPVLEEALHLQPAFAAARNLRAVALAALGRTGEAIAVLRDAIARDPTQAAVWANLGLLLKDDGRFDEALAAYAKAVALAPDDAQIRVNRVVARLRAGRWAEAWPDYEWRLKLAGGRTDRLLPALSEMPELAGRTILATHEDGFGDTLHFARYLPLLAARGARVVARVPATLLRVMRTVPGVDAVVGMHEPVPDHDYRCPFFSLPRAFETVPGTIPAPIPYLSAEHALAEAWARRLPQGGLRAGLVWAGQARPALPGFSVLDARRSMQLATLAPLAAVPDVAFVSLQHGPEAAQGRTPPAGMTLHDPMGAVRDFADTAAIIANLDLVISVDTSVVHLAGALGKPVFMLDRYDHCWRWLSGREDSPWYPAMRIFRQEQIGDWAPVLERAAVALVEAAAAQR